MWLVAADLDCGKRGGILILSLREAILRSGMDSGVLGESMTFSLEARRLICAPGVVLEMHKRGK